MKSLANRLLLATMVTAAFNVKAQTSFTINDAIKVGLKFSFTEELKRRFGDEGSVFLQNGSITEENHLLKKIPYCSVKFDSGYRGELEGAYVLKNQEMIAMDVESSGSRVNVMGLGSNKGSFKINAVGVFLDSEKAGYKGQMRSILEMQPGSLKMALNCTGFNSQLSFEDFKHTIGDDLFTVKVQVGAGNELFSLGRDSVSYKKAIEEKKVKEKKLAEEKAEKERKKKEESLQREQDAIRELGVEANGAEELGVLKAGYSFVLKDNIKAFTDKSGFSSKIYQNGINVGAVKDGQIYESKVNPIDQQKPYCKISYISGKAYPTTIELKYPAGIYEVEVAKYYKNIKSALIEIKYKGELEVEGVTKGFLTCENIKIIDDLKSALGPESKIFATELRNIEINGEELIPLAVKDESNRDAKDAGNSKIEDNAQIQSSQPL
jgi:hypothetical protein